MEPALTDGFQFQAALLQPAQTALVLLVQGAETGPKVASYKQKEERDSEEVIGLDGIRDHRHEEGSNGDFDVREPAALASIFFRLEVDMAVADGEFGRPDKAAPDAE